jgi:5-methylthioadenosine/S-adenosylhomocysteine deaminase
MEGRLLLKDCAVVDAGGHVRREVAVVVEGPRIQEVRPDAEVPVRPGDWEVACRGRLVSAGFTDCDARLVSGAIRGREAWRRTAGERFEQQRSVDAGITRGAAEAIAADAIARSLRAGVTAVVEQLHAPTDVAGALEAVAGTAERLGLRALVSHSSSTLEAVEANAAFVHGRASHPLVRGALGLHDASDALLTRLAERRGERLVVDGSGGAISRLSHHGLLDGSAVATLACAPDAQEMDQLGRSGALVVWTPADPDAPDFESVESSLRLALGSGGTDLRRNIAAAFLSLIRDARAGGPVDPDRTLARMLFDAPAELFGAIFGARPGVIEPGALADLVVHDFVPSEVEPEPWFLRAAPVAWTIVNGRVCVREGALLGTDAIELSREAARAVASFRR